MVQFCNGFGTTWLIIARQLMSVLLVKAAPNGACLYMQLVRCFKLLWSNAAGHVLVCEELKGAPSPSPGGIGRRICAADQRAEAFMGHSQMALRPSPPPKAPIPRRQATWTCSWWRMLQKIGVAIDVQLGDRWRTRVLRPFPLSPRERGCTRHTRRAIATSLLQTLSGMA
jgi:hypothetical protein